MAEIVRVNPKRPEPARMARAAELIRAGQVVAIPTDTFYGLAANPFDPAAVERVFAIKGRPQNMPLLLLIDSVEMARELARNLPPQFERLAECFWPGPLTIVLEAAANVPARVTGGTGRIGLRLPAAEIPRAVVKHAGVPVTGTSANRTGEPECASAREVEQRLGDSVSMILDGGVSRAKRTSTVVGVRTDFWEVLREGAITADQIAAVLGPRKHGNPDPAP